MAKGKYHEWLTEEGLLKLEGWARNGLTDEQIAHNMGIGLRTLYDYKERYPQISQSLKRGKEVVDLMVENALLKRAIGYDVVETKKEVDNNEYSKVIETKRHVPADITACIYWLNNRKPDNWRNRKNVEIKGEVKGEVNNPFSGLTTEELKALIKDD